MGVFSRINSTFACLNSSLWSIYYVLGIMPRCRAIGNLTCSWLKVADPEGAGRTEVLCVRLESAGWEIVTRWNAKGMGWGEWSCLSIHLKVHSFIHSFSNCLLRAYQVSPALWQGRQGGRDKEAETIKRASWVKSCPSSLRRKPILIQRVEAGIPLEDIPFVCLSDPPTQWRVTCVLSGWWMGRWGCPGLNGWKHWPHWEAWGRTEQWTEGRTRILGQVLPPIFFRVTWG